MAQALLHPSPSSAASRSTNTRPARPEPHIQPTFSLAQCRHALPPPPLIRCTAGTLLVFLGRRRGRSPPFSGVAEVSIGKPWRHPQSGRRACPRCLPFFSATYILSTSTLNRHSSSFMEPNLDFHFGFPSSEVPLSDLDVRHSGQLERPLAQPRLVQRLVPDDAIRLAVALGLVGARVPRVRPVRGADLGCSKKKSASSPGVKSSSRSTYRPRRPSS